MCLKIKHDNCYFSHKILHFRIQNVNLFKTSLEGLFGFGGGTSEKDKLLHAYFRLQDNLGIDIHTMYKYTLLMYLMKF